MWPAPSTEERRADAPARDGAADSRQATTDSPREGMPGPSTGYRPRRHCWGRAEPRRRRVWLRSHAKSARVEPSRSQANYRSCSLELGRRRLSSPTSPPQPVALVLVTAQEKKRKKIPRWSPLSVSPSLPPPCSVRRRTHASPPPVNPGPRAGHPRLPCHVRPSLALILHDDAVALSSTASPSQTLAVPLHHCRRPRAPSSPSIRRLR